MPLGNRPRSPLNFFLDLILPSLSIPGQPFLLQAGATIMDKMMIIYKTFFFIKRMSKVKESLIIKITLL